MEVTKSKEPTQGAKEEQKPELDSAIIDELMKGYQRPEDMTGPGGILEQLTKRVYERILGADVALYLNRRLGSQAIHDLNAVTAIVYDLSTGRQISRQLVLEPAGAEGCQRHWLARSFASVSATSCLSFRYCLPKSVI